MRALTAKERAILAHVVVDPDAWWTHANTAENIRDPEACLIAKVLRWKPDYDKAVAAGGYKTRAEREAEGLIKR